MTTRAEHLAEMRVAVERRCSLAEAKGHLARTKHYAGEEALRKVRGERAPEGALPPEQQGTQSRFWWKEHD